MTRASLSTARTKRLIAGLLATTSTLAIGFVTSAGAQVITPPSQGGTYTLDASNRVVTATVDGAVAAPVILETDNDWSIAARIEGAFSIVGLPADTPSNGALQYRALGSAAEAMALSQGAGDVTVTFGTSGATGLDSVTVGSVTGGGAAPAALWVGSVGTDGYLAPGQVDWMNQYIDDFSLGALFGSDGGAVSVGVEGSAAITVSGTGSGGTLAGRPSFAGVTAESVGGHATSATDPQGDPFAGNGGNAGDVAVATAAGSKITVGASGPSGAAGIYAFAQGGALGEAESYYTGLAGAAGDVTVDHAGEITVTDPTGFGIYALSVGGDGYQGDDTDLPAGAGQPADGGSVTVTLESGATIAMPQGGVGVFAFSRAGGWEPFGSPYEPSGGSVSVTLDEAASVSTGGPGGTFGFGVLAMSAGNALVDADPYEIEGSGVAGAVAIANMGDIGTMGALSFGLAGLAIGGTPVVTSVESGSNVIGNTTTLAAAGGGSVTVTHGGTIVTAGDSAAGILALSAGGGGIVANDAASAVDAAASTFTAGTLLGANSDADAPATDGGNVSVTVSGAITTGAAGSGIGAFGVLAQSIGGSGGVAGGSAGLTNIGDAGGGGGSGGTVTVDLDGGTAIATAGKNAHGVLAQSIGGGGGSGVNSTGAFVAVGGTGGSGGDGGTVTLNTNGGVGLSTAANYAHGALVQSIGGGGGNGGIADSAGVFVDVATGGNGGAGGDGGTAGLYNFAGSTMRTVGNHSVGGLVQSVGGGGGAGGSATAYSAGVVFSMATAVGGAGGNGGTGGLATGINHGTITTGLAPQNLETTAFVADTGIFYATLADQSEINAFFTSGELENGRLSGTLGPVTLASGEVVEDVTVSGNTITGTVGGEPYSASIVAGGIVNAVSTDETGAFVNAILLADKFTVPTGGPNPNGANSDGLVVQSIGGGGGRGGASAAKSLVLPLASFDQEPLKTPTISISEAIGGSGGAGGNGGGVTAGNYLEITTFGDSSRGMVAQSVGGGGGLGGDATATSTAIQSAGKDLQVVTGIGGSGGVAGDGETVTAFNGTSDGSENGAIATFGQYASGILAQSIGGGGGAGGTGSATGSTPALHYPTGNSLSRALGVGGTGGAAGDGGSVFVTNYAQSSITTAGSDSRAIHAQSIGGGGGDAGGGAATGAGDTLSIDIAIGAVGGGGGDGGEVAVTNSGPIATTGGGGHGILAQSVGGGGGAGGSVDSVASSVSLPTALNRPSVDAQNWLTQSNSLDLHLGVGGGGGAGGDGGPVTVSNDAASTGAPLPTITTAGERAFGILAQSIANSGGVGGGSSATSRSAPSGLVVPNPADRRFTVAARIGGGDGTGGRAGSVAITNGGTVTTTGYGAMGMFGQSVAGGGGYGVDATVDSDVDLSVVSATQGDSGTDMFGGDVTVDTTAGSSVVTAGADAPAIFAQSVGGGGGLGSSGSDAFQTVGGGAAGTASHVIVLGGSNGMTDREAYYGDIDNDGGAVTVKQGGSVATAGDWSHGIVAQSIGGGGGYASLYTTDSVRVDTTILVADGTGYGDGGAVSVDLSGGPSSGIVTGSAARTGGGTAGTGYSAYGILAQSIGGGGGFAAENTAAGGSASGEIVLGGSNWGNGGNVTVNGPALVGTHGDAAHAVVLQSIGGGGGIAGQGSSVPVEGLSRAVSLEILLPTTYTTGSGGAVALDSQADLTTAGASAYGILAQSIGGSGGVVFAQNAADTTQSSILAGHGMSNGDYDQSGGSVAITLESGSTIATTGAAAHAIVAQSIGGGGGIVGYQTGPGLTFPTTATTNAPGNGGFITIEVDGVISTTGASAHGILAQSIGGGGGLIARNGTVVAGSTGSGGGYGGNILIEQSGTLTASGSDSMGIFAQSTQEPSGLSKPVDIVISGAVAGGSGSGAGVWIDGGLGNGIDIAPGGSLSALSGDAVRYTGYGGLTVGNEGTLSGNLAIGGGMLENDGIYDVGTGATVDGTFVQNADGTLRFTVTEDTSARLTVTGISEFSGAVDPVVTTWLLPGTQTLIVSDEAALVTGSVTTPGNAVFGWAFDAGEGTANTIAPTATFVGAAQGLGANAQSAAGYLQTEWDVANPALSGVFADIYTLADAPGGYQAVLASLSPEASQSLATHLGDISGTLLGSALSCPEFQGAGTLIGEGSCVWLGGGGDILERSHGDGRVSRLSTGVGGQAEFAEGWVIGGALGFDTTHASGDDFSGDGHIYSASVALKRVAGPWLLGGALTTSFADNAMSRRIAADGSTATSDSRAVLIGGRLRAAYDVAFERAYVRPGLDIDLYHLHTPSYRENGASPYALEVGPSGDTNIVFSPSVEIGMRGGLGDAVVRGYVNVGAMLTPTAGREVPAALAGSQGDFQTTIDTADVMATFKAGLQVYKTRSWDVRGETYLGLGDGVTGYGGQLRLSYRY